MEKYCPRCETTKPLEEFYKLKNRCSQYSSYCKLCVIEREKLRYRVKEDTVGKPGKYTNDEERREVFKFLKALGWKFNEKLNLWWKLPLKDRNGIWKKQSSQSTN